MSDTKFLKDFFGGAAKDGAPEAASRADEIVANINNRGLEVKHGNSQEKSILVDRHGQAVPLDEVADFLVDLTKELKYVTSELEQNLLDSGKIKGLQTEFITSSRSTVTIHDSLSDDLAGKSAIAKFPEHGEKIGTALTLHKTMDKLLKQHYETGRGNVTSKTDVRERVEEPPDMLAQRMVRGAMEDHLTKGQTDQVKANLLENVPGYSPAEILIRKHQEQNLVVKGGKIIDQNSGKDVSEAEFKGMQKEVSAASHDIIKQLAQEYGADALFEEETLNGEKVLTYKLFELEGGEEILNEKFPGHSNEIEQACALGEIHSEQVSIESKLLLNDDGYMTKAPEEEISGASLESP